MEKKVRMVSLQQLGLPLIFSPMEHCCLQLGKSAEHIENVLIIQDTDLKYFIIIIETRAETRPLNTYHRSTYSQWTEGYVCLAGRVRV